MAPLQDVSVAELEAAFDAAEGKTETMRLLVAIIYKRGPSVPMLAEWLDLRPATIYGWFDRMEDEPLERAVRERAKPGRPSKLSDEQVREFRETVRDPPATSGYDGPAWTTDLARHYVRAEFGVAYSRRHVQRLLRDAGLERLPTDAVPDEVDGNTHFWGPEEA